MKKLLKLAGVGAMSAFLVLSPSSVTAADLAHQSGGDGILVVDVEKVLVQSSAGEKGSVQLNKMLEALKKRADQLKKTLENEAQAIGKQKEDGKISDEKFQAKVRELGQKEQGYNKELADGQQSLTVTQNYMRQKIYEAIQPILNDLIKEKNARIIITRSATLAFATPIDVTDDVITRLNKKLPMIKVDQKAIAEAAKQQ